MEIMKVLKRLRNDGKINSQQYKTYKGQAVHGDGIGCVKGLLRKHLIEDEEAQALISSCTLACTE